MNSDAIKVAANRVIRRQAASRRSDAKRETEALHDVDMIIEFLVANYNPARIYQWGSLLRPGAFRDYSDIDIAVEGILQPETFFRLLGDVQRLTEFDVDLVQIEKIEPEYAEDIRRKGKLVYERK